ncbi:MAG: glucose-1-phosphate thymidylyltransferase, partial [Propionibacterium sp.]
FCGSDRFVAINSDNYYPAPELGQLVALPGCGALGFDPEALVSKGNIAADRVSAYAVMTREAGKLAQIIEKPDPKTLASLGEVLVSMNCWLFDASIFTAISQIDKSARGEYEIVDAVRQAISDGNPFDVVPVHSACLDLSNRGDIASVAAALESHEVRL